MEERNGQGTQQAFLVLCEMDKRDQLLVSTLYFKVCREYESKIIGYRKFSNDSYNHRTT